MQTIPQSYGGCQGGISNSLKNFGIILFYNYCIIELQWKTVVVINLKANFYTYVLGLQAV